MRLVRGRGRVGVGFGVIVGVRVRVGVRLRLRLRLRLRAQGLKGSRALGVGCALSRLSHASLVPSSLSGESADSQFCETKKVKAPAGWYEVRVSSSSTPAWLGLEVG